MKRYNVTVNGTTYDVSVEESGAAPFAPVPAVSAPAAPAQPAQAAPAVAPAPAAPVQAAPKAPAATGTMGNIKIESPMPGVIVDVKANVGDSVKNGTVIAVLEAMKMENDIVAATEGVITSINVSKGASVNTGALIATMSN